MGRYGPIIHLNSSFICGYTQGCDMIISKCYSLLIPVTSSKVYVPAFC